MKSAKMLTIVVLALGLMVCLPKVSEAEPMGSAFTYQGRLMDANLPADEIYDFRFKLFDEANTVTGNQVGGDVNQPDVDVIDGYFTVELDFNEPNAFNGDARWLQTAVRPGDSCDPNGFVILSPRQEVTPTPYALYAVKAAGFYIPMKLGDGAHTPMLSNTDIQLDHADSDYHLVEIRNNEGASVWGINQDGGTSFGPYTAGKDLHLFGGDQVRMTLKGDTGNIGVGLGPVPPTERLDVAGGNIRVRGTDGFDGAGESAYLYLGDENQYIKSEWGFGLTLGSYLVPEALTIRETSGNVGLGTTDPQAALHVYSPSSNFGMLKLQNSNPGVNEASMAFVPGSDVTPDDYWVQGVGLSEDANDFVIGRSGPKVVVTPEGNVGIGTTSPSAKLEVVGDVEVNGFFFSKHVQAIDSSLVVPAITGINESSPITIIWDRKVGVYGSADSGYGGCFRTQNNGAGYDIGVHGQANSEQGTGVYGEASASSGTNYGVFGKTKSSSGYGGYFIGRGYFSDKVGIGTTTPDEKLTVEGTIKANAEILGVYGYASNTGDVQNHGGYFRADGQSGMGVYGYATGSNGRGVYGLATGQDGCGVYGHAGYGFGGTFDSFGMGGVGVSGSAPNTLGKGVVGIGNAYDFYADGPGTDYGSTSSIRWKNDIRPIDEPLEKVMALRGVYFNWDAEHGGGHDVGMVAEEVGKVLPEIVEYEENGIDATGMDYSKLTPLLVEAVKELKKENDLLKQRIEVLERNP